MCAADGDLILTQALREDDVGLRVRAAFLDCWIQVSNTGGAAGFPFPPVDATDVAPVLDGLLHGLAPERSRLIVASLDGVVAGWVSLTRQPNPLVAHWGTIRHLQTHPRFRRRGIGVSLMSHARHVARDEMELSQLHLAVRGGMGLEDFYRRLGWREVGRWPGALRLADGDYRDEVLMLLDPL